MSKKKKGVIIYWKDATMYHDSGTYKPSIMVTEGILAKKNRYYIYVEKPITVSIQGDRIQNHTGNHTKDPLYMCFHKATIDSVEEVELDSHTKHYENKKKRIR